MKLRYILLVAIFAGVLAVYHDAIEIPNHLNLWIAYVFGALALGAFVLIFLLLMQRWKRRSKERCLARERRPVAPWYGRKRCF